MKQIVGTVGMKMAIFRGISLVTLFFAVPAAAREPIEATAEISRIQLAPGGTITVTRDGVALKPVFARQLLFDGDEIHVSGNGNVQVRDFLAHKNVLVAASSGPLRIRGVRQRTWSDGARNYLVAFAHLFDRKPSPIVVYTLTRAPDARPVSMLSALSNATQKVPVGVRSVPILWRDAPGEVTARSVASTEIVPLSALAEASISIKTLPVDVTVTGADGIAIRWKIEAGDHPPPPPWRLDYPGSSETADRVASAAWMLTSGPTEWRLFAIGELRDLSQVDPLADRLWRAIRSGDWQGEHKS